MEQLEQEASELKKEILLYKAESEEGEKACILGMWCIVFPLSIIGYKLHGFLPLFLLIPAQILLTIALYLKQSVKDEDN